VALRPEIRELVLLFAQQAARDFLAEEAAPHMALPAENAANKAAPADRDGAEKEPGNARVYGTAAGA
jgi:hypothetical protein